MDFERSVPVTASTTDPGPSKDGLCLDLIPAIPLKVLQNLGVTAVSRFATKERK
jgi:hypothetical protein